MAASEADAELVRVFAPAYYVEFDPVTALDMVTRTPGFNPQQSDGGRGLSGVRSNILIDGERPPPKGRSIWQQLREIPVYGVDHLELIDAGARLDIDMQGFPQVLNVVTAENKPAYYEVVTQFRRAGTGDYEQRNEASSEIGATGSFGWRQHEFTLRADLEDQSSRSPADFVAIDPANPQQRITSLTRSGNNQNNLELSGLFALPQDSSLSFNGQFRASDSSSSPIVLYEDPNAPSAVDQSYDSRNDNRDISTEYSREMGERGSLLLAFVDSLSTDQNDSSLTDGGLTRSSIRNRESGETAARLLVTRSPKDRLTYRTTLTSAFNYFEGGFEIFENGVPVPVAGSDSRVEEDRHSLEASVDWTPNEKWTVTGSLGAEAYEIVSRDVSTGLQTDPKGSMTFSYRPEPRTTISLESQRRIGQLSFSQFLASANLSSEILTAGAGVLEPERRWTHTASYDRRFGDVGVLRFELTHEVRDNPVRSVALSDSLIVARNTSPQTIDSTRASVQFPFDRFGREDLVLGLSGRLARSRTVDPITGETRPVSGLTKRYWSVELRRDPGDGRLSWDMYVDQQTRGLNYSVRQISDSSESREWGASVQWEPIDGLKFSASLEGPRTSFSSSSFFGAVREPGLVPSFVSSTITRVDRAASISMEWRRTQHVEIRATLNTRPKILSVESLGPYDGAIESELRTEIAMTPRATVRFRVHR